MNAVIFDTEVNSLDHLECIELAYRKMRENQAGNIEVESETTVERFKPTKPIDAGAASVCLIAPEHLESCRPSSEATLPEADYLIAHNVDFDCDVLGIMAGRRICTLAMCRHIWPEFKSHTLSAMFLELEGINAANIEKIKDAHAADADVNILIVIIGHILEKTGIKSLSELHAFSEIARVPTVWAFGKHKGTRINETPRDYIQWMMRQPDVDQYLMKALKSVTG